MRIKKSIFFFIIINLLSCSLGVQEGGNIGQMFTGIESIQGLSPNSVRIKWVKPQGYNNFNVYAGKENEELISRGTTRLSSMILNNLSSGSSYRFAVEATQEKTGKKLGKENIKYYNTWNDFQGVISVDSLSPYSIQALWGFDTEEGMTYKVYISIGNDNPALNDEPFSIVQDTLINIIDLNPSTKYNILVRAIYPNGEEDKNSRILSTTTDSSVEMPVVLVDEVILGKRPTLRVSNIKEGVEVYILHSEYKDLENNIINKFDTQVAGPIKSNGAIQTNFAYKDFLQGIHKLKVRVKKGNENIILPQTLTFRVRALIENKWNIVETDYAYPQNLARASSLNKTVGAGSGLDLYRPLGWGRALASGDFNGDGVDDLAIGVAYSTKEKLNPYFRYAKGFVVIFYGVEGSGLRTSVEPSLSPLNPYDPLIIDSPFENDKSNNFQEAYFGYSMDAGKFVKKANNIRVKTGDINGDGYSDLIVSAPLTTLYTPTNGYHYDTGAVYIFYGSYIGINYSSSFLEDANNSCSGLCDNLIIRNPIFDTRADDRNDAAFFGSKVAHIGDINGDGYGDIAISAPGTDYAVSGTLTRSLGEVYIYYGSQNGLIVKYGPEPNPNQPPIRITIRGIYSSSCQAGLAPCVGYNYQSTAPDILATGITPLIKQQFGNDIAGGINIVNNNGKPDLLISAPGYDNDAGALFLFSNHPQKDGADLKIGAGYQTYIRIDPPSGLFSSGKLFFGYSLETIADSNVDAYGEVVASLGYNTTLPGTRKEGVLILYGKDGGVHNTAGCGGGGLNYVYNTQSCNVGFCCPQFLDLGTCSSGSINTDENSTYWGSRDPVTGINSADFDGNGIGDLILGRPWTDTNGNNTGSACVYKGQTNIGIHPMVYTIRDDTYSIDNLYFADSITVGDYKLSGKDDIAISIPRAQVEGRALNGAVGLYYDYSFISTTTVAGSYINANYVGELQSIEQVPLHAGDINGDGFDDIVVRIRYYINGAITYGFIVIYGSSSGLVIDEAGFSYDPYTLKPQLFLPMNEVSNYPSTDICYNIIPIGDVNGDGYNDIHCNDNAYNYSMVFYGSHQGIVGGAYTAYKNRQAGDINPQLYYSYLGGNGLGNYYFQAFAYYSTYLQNYVGLGNFNGDTNTQNGYAFNDIAFSSTIYGYNSGNNSRYYGNVWVAYGSSKGLQEPSNHDHARLSVPYKELTDLYHPTGAFCYTDQVTMNIGANLQRVCDGLPATNGAYTCKVQQLAGYDAKVEDGTCDTAGKELSPPGFEIGIRQQHYGNSLSAIDYNGDGIDDLAVGAFYIYVNDGTTDRIAAGRVYLYKGTKYGLVYDEISSDNLFETIKDIYLNEQSINYYHTGSTKLESNYFGRTVSNVGDIDGNGFDDLLISSSGRTHWGVNFLIYGGKANGAEKTLYLNNDLGVADRYLINKNNTCTSNSCKILIFYPPMSTSSYCNYPLGLGNINGGNYGDLLINCPYRSVHNGSVTGGGFGSGESFLYTGSPNGLVVEGLLSQGTYSNTPICIGGICTPYNFYPQSVEKTYREYGGIMLQGRTSLGSDFNGDTFNDFIVPLGVTSKYGISSYVGGFFIFY